MIRLILSKTFNLKTILLFCLFINTLMANEPDKVSLQLKWKYQFQFAGFIIAKEKGFYKDVGLDVELKEYENETTIIKDVLLGKSTFGINDSSLILEKMKGKPIVAMMAILQDSPNVLMGLKSSGIKELKDLNNKKLALYEDVSAMTILSMLKANHINYKSYNVIFGLDKLISKEIDMSSAYIANEPFVASEKGFDTVIFNPKNYGFDSYGDMLFTSQNKLKDNPDQVRDFYEASKKGWEYAFMNIDETVNIIYNKYNTLQKSKKALTYEANVLKKISNIENNFGNIDKKKIKSIATLLSFMINDKYDLNNLDNFIYKIDTNEIYLTKEEKEYLKNKESIDMCYNTTITPYTMIEDEEPVGVSVDYLRQVEKKINKKFNFIYTDSIKEQFTMVYNKKCLTVPVIQRSPQSVPFVQATVSAGKDNLVLVTKIDEPYIFNMEKLNTKKIGINKDYIHLTAYLDKNHPYIKYIKIEGNGLEKVKKGELFGVIGTSIEMNYDLTKNYKDSLKVMTDYVDSYIEGGIGVHTDEPILLSILSKAVESVGKTSREKIYDKWINVKYKEIINHTFVWQIVVISFLLISITLFWNRRLNNEIKRRKKVEKDLQEISDAHIDFIADLPIGIVSSDPRGEKMSHCNATFLQMFGWDFEEIDTVDKWFNKAYPDYKYRVQVLKLWEEKVDEAYKNNKPYSTPMEVNVTCKDGSTKWCLVNYYEKKQFLHAGVFVDISERKNAEKQLFKLNTSLENRVQSEISRNKKHQLLMMEQTKRAQMGEMIENIAHQWRQPLAQINSAVLLTDAIIENSDFQDEKVTNKLLEIESLTNYMSKTINDFQEFVNPNKIKETFFLHEAIEESLFLVKGSLTSNYIELITKLDSTLVCDFYKNELKQVLVILLNNARDIIIERKIRNPKIFINTKKNDSHHIIEIADNAGGIDSNIVDKIFDPYFTTKHKTQGTGLGLYMATMILKNGLKAQLTVENTSSGASFKIHIPKERI